MSSRAEVVLNLTVWRIAKRGEGTAGSNGTGSQRWNSEGVSVLHAAESPALAAMELLAHLDRKALREDYELVPIEISDNLVRHLEPNALPTNWKEDPPPPALKHIGDDWIKSQPSPVLRVPSALIEQENNFLLNPKHPDFHKLVFHKAQPFRFDPRLLKL